MSWIFLTLLAAGLETAGDIHDRFILKNDVKNSDTLLVFWGFFAGAMFAAPAFLTGTFSYDPLALGLGFASALLYLLAMHYYYKALNSEEVSRVVPILSLNPVIVLILATLFLGETYTWAQGLGMALIVLGVVLHAIDREHHRLINKKALFWVILSAAAYALKNILVKWLSMNPIDPLNVLCWVGIGILIFNIPITIRLFPKLPLRKNPHLHNIILAAALTGSSTLIYTAAVTVGPAALVAFLDRIQIFFVFVIAEAMDFFQPKLLHEKFSKPAFYQKLLGVILVLVGSYYLL